jgi:hypothetical protein
VITKEKKALKVRIVSKKSSESLREKAIIQSLSRLREMAQVPALRRTILRRSNAIVALEGYVPTTFDRELDRGLVSGKLTTSQAITLIKKRAVKFRKQAAQGTSKKSYRIVVA